MDASDLMKDPVVKFQHDNYFPLFLATTLLLPVGMSMAFLGESLMPALVIGVGMRYAISFHITFFVNSAAHMFGDRPYNDRIPSSENPWISWAAIGEGYHNYHHAYPWDYATGETGNRFNFTKVFIDFMFKIGQAYNLKSASDELISMSKAKVIENKVLLGNQVYTEEWMEEKRWG